MRIKRAALLSVFAFYAGPALADTALVEPPRKPKKITSFELRKTSVEIVAVTRRARSDTTFHKRYVDESLAMNKVYPGYPKPAYVSFDLRVPF